MGTGRRYQPQQSLANTTVRQSHRVRRRIFWDCFLLLIGWKLISMLFHSLSWSIISVRSRWCLQVSSKQLLNLRISHWYFYCCYWSFRSSCLMIVIDLTTPSNLWDLFHTLVNNARKVVDNAMEQFSKRSCDSYQAFLIDRNSAFKAHKVRIGILFKVSLRFLRLFVRFCTEWSARIHSLGWSQMNHYAVLCRLNFKASAWILLVNQRSLK